VVYLVTLLCTSFAVPDALIRVRGHAPSWTLLLPSCWFLSLCHALRGRGGPAVMELARLALPAIAVLALAAPALYAIGYGRHFMRIPEMTDSTVGARTTRRSSLGWLLQRLVLRTPFQSGCFGFVWKTMLRSETHRLVLTGVGGLGLVLASEAMMNAFYGANSLPVAALSPQALSVPYILTFFVIVGLRIVFEIPVELRSNWIFQLMLDRDHQECEGLARKIILTLVLPLVLVTLFPAYVYLEGVGVASLHTLVVGVWAGLLTNIVLVRFRKLPFTCTLPLFKQHSIVTFVGCCFGYLIYAVSTPEFESSAMSRPVRMISLAPVAAVAWLVPHLLAKSTIDIEKTLIFEEPATRAFETLRLSDGN
jgi:hypothetical protein